jgi:hypothetical protein
MYQWFSHVPSNVYGQFSEPDLYRVRDTHRLTITGVKVYKRVTELYVETATINASFQTLSNYILCKNNQSYLHQTAIYIWDYFH